MRRLIELNKKEIYTIFGGTKNDKRIKKNNDKTIDFDANGYIDGKQKCFDARCGIKFPVGDNVNINAHVGGGINNGQPYFKSGIHVEVRN